MKFKAMIETEIAKDPMAPQRGSPAYEELLRNIGEKFMTNRHLLSMITTTVSFQAGLTDKNRAEGLTTELIRELMSNVPSTKYPDIEIPEQIVPIVIGIVRNQIEELGELGDEE